MALLAGCWSLASTGNFVLISVAALSGHLLAADKSLALLPIALQWVGTAGATVPASFLMRRIGRRGGFMVGGMLGLAGSGLAALAIYWGSFPLLCLGLMLVGAYNGFNWYYRFAAAEVAPDAFASRAISLVLAGGVGAALIGPTIAGFSRVAVAGHLYMGAYLAYFGLCLAILVLLQFVRIPRPAAADLRGGRPMRELLRLPAYRVAVLAAVVAYAVMVLLMAVTPLAMRLHDHSFADSTFVIQWHALGMYAPAFFTGHLVRRFGTLAIMGAGGLAMAGAVAAALAGTGIENFWTALALLGLGWNFLFVAATTLLNETVTVAERAKAQAMNEFAVFATVALCTFLAGPLLHEYGWSAVNLAALPLILSVIGATLWLAIARRGKVAA